MGAQLCNFIGRGADHTERAVCFFCGAIIRAKITGLLQRFGS